MYSRLHHKFDFISIVTDTIEKEQEKKTSEGCKKAQENSKKDDSVSDRNMGGNGNMLITKIVVRVPVCVIDKYVFQHYSLE